ncbi:hypothetical protein L7F22_011665 [Adiantum nelumboides]|nr:hypothetical protein [Adiantum nelumboides]
MEGDTVEAQTEVHNAEAQKKKAATVVDSKAGKKRRRSELPSPTSDRPTRERKSIERLIVSPDKEIKEFRVPKGTGTALKDIPNIVFKLSKRRSGDEAVQALHKVLFGKTSKHAGKGNILKFSGFVWSGNEEKEKLKIKERLERVVKEILYQIGDLLDLNLSKGLKKEESVLKVFEFLESPHKTTDKLVEEKVKAKKSKKAKKKVVKGAKKGRTPVKSPKGMNKSSKKKQSSDEEDDDDVADSEDAVEETEEVEDEPEDRSDDDYGEKKKLTATRKRKRKPVVEELPDQETEDEEEASPKKSKVQKQKRKATPKPKKEKKSKSKTEKVKEPSEEELKVAICEILQNADFSKVTFTDVMKQLGDKFKVDLTHIKSHLKALIQEEIARLVGEGDNEDEDSHTEGGDDEEKLSGEPEDHDKDSRDGPKEDEEDDDGNVEDSVGGDDENDKGVKAGDEDADEDMNSEEDKADSAREDEGAQVEGGDEEVEDASKDAA